MRNFTFLLTVLLLFLTLQASAQRGTLIEAIPLVSATQDEILTTLKNDLGDDAFSLVNLFTWKKHPVAAIKLIYKTIDSKGKPTTASGVVFLPQVSKKAGLPVVMYLHGTLTRNLDAPSNLNGIETVMGWVMAMDGYIAVMPDYLGFGEEPGIHPYHHAASEASASIDMLKAALTLCGKPEILANQNGNLYLCGYSQGGHAALATHEEIQKNPIPGIVLRKTIAGSGAYSLSVAQKNSLFKHSEYQSPSFLPFLLMGFQEAYGNLYSNLGQVFVPPYNLTIPNLFDGSHTASEINNQLPTAWKTMFVPKYLWNMQYNYFDPVNTALRKNDVINWKPKSDLHLYYCTCDELVTNENSILAYLSFLLKGSNKVTCLPVGPFKHAECAPFVLLLSKIQFDCASGANPCGMNLLSLLKSATKEEYPEFRNAVANLDATLDVDKLMENAEISALLQTSDTSADLVVWPNPVSDVLSIQKPAHIEGTVRLKMIDMSGRIVLNSNFTGTIIQIDVKSMTPGAYKIILNGETVLSKTVIITK